MEQQLGLPSTINGYFVGTLEAYQQSFSEPILHYYRASHGVYRAGNSLREPHSSADNYFDTDSDLRRDTERWTNPQIVRRVAGMPSLQAQPLHELVVAASRLLTAIPAMIKLKMTAANNSNQPQYWPGWRRARMKCRP